MERKELVKMCKHFGLGATGKTEELQEKWEDFKEEVETMVEVKTNPANQVYRDKKSVAGKTYLGVCPKTKEKLYL